MKGDLYMNNRLLLLLEKKYSQTPLSLQELEELRRLLIKEKDDTHETIAIKKFTYQC